MSEENQEFDKYGRKIRKDASLPILLTVAAIAFVGGITAVALNQTQSGTSDSPKTEAYATDIPGDNIIHVGDDDRLYTVLAQETTPATTPH